jgi:Zn-dependent protease/CBS domain-containing protein
LVTARFVEFRRDHYNEMQEAAHRTRSCNGWEEAIQTMRGWSFPLGRWLGVDLRIHTFFVLLLGISLFASSELDASAWRGVMLWLLLLLAVLVREIARLTAAAYYGLQLRTVLLLPIGGLFSYANPDSVERATESKVQTPLALVGPIANVAFAVMIGSLMLGASNGINLLTRPWITPLYLMRSAVWMNLLLGLLNLLPAYPLDGGRVLRGAWTRAGGIAQATKKSTAVSQVIAIVIICGGVLLRNPWLIMAGSFIFIGAQLEDQGVLFQSVVDTVHMRDVMLTDFSTLSPSDTLEDALFKAIHSLQDDFPVVRGSFLVGIVSKQRILDTLRSEGNGYVQAIMSKAFQVAQPGDSLGAMIRRITRGRGLSLIPVTEGEKIVGIVTLQNLMHSMSMLAEHRKHVRDSSDS